MRNLIFVFATIFFFVSCTTKELPVPKHEPGEASVGEVSMGENYDYQIFYSLAKNAVIQKNIKTIWDIAFESSEDGYRIIMNSSKLMSAYNTLKHDFNAVADTSGFENGKAFDASSGVLDSTAIGDWRTEGTVFILNRGITVAGNIGFVKLQVDKVDASGYDITFQLLPDGKENAIRIPKNSAYNFSFLSFENNGEIVDVEPPKTEWDICFTQFTVQIPTPYLVTGVLLNSYQTLGQQDTSVSFDAIDLAFARQLQLLDANDIIGYQWKEFNFSASTYLVNPLINYIVKTHDDVYYKLHFIDFYNNEGVKGNPKWEFVRL